jgi:pyruvate kinase
VIRTVREVAQQRGIICPIILDTKGPEIRVGNVLVDQGVDIVSGSSVEVIGGMNLTSKDTVSTSERVFISYGKLGSSVKEGDVVLLDNGRIALSVSKVKNLSSVICKVISGGPLKAHKGVNLPGCWVDLPHVTAKDERDVAFAVSRQIEYIAHSFIRSKEGINQVRALPGVQSSGIHIIAKIESQQGLDNFAEILDVSDGIMVARGDLGVEIPLERVCSMQKRIIRDCNVRGKFVITATEMLDSMISNPRPTRAEASDVANAVFDGTDCVMLSGETAVGKFPLETVQVMARICKEAELDVAEHSFISMGEMPNVFQNFFQNEKRSVNPEDKLSQLGNIKPTVLSPIDEHREAFARAAVSTADATGAAIIVVFCKFTDSARFVAKHRPSVPVFALATSPKVCGQISLYRGVRPLLVPTLQKESITFALTVAHNANLIEEGSKVLLLRLGDDDSNIIETIVVEKRHLAEKNTSKLLDYTPGSSIWGP